MIEVGAAQPQAPKWTGGAWDDVERWVLWIGHIKCSVSKDGAKVSVHAENVMVPHCGHRISTIDTTGYRKWQGNCASVDEAKQIAVRFASELIHNDELLLAKAKAELAMIGGAQ